MAIFGLVMKNAVTMRHTCGGTVKMSGSSNVNNSRLMTPAYPSADTTTAAAVMVRVTGGRVQKTSMVGNYGVYQSSVKEWYCENCGRQPEEEAEVDGKPWQLFNKAQPHPRSYLVPCARS